MFQARPDLLTSSSAIRAVVDTIKERVNRERNIFRTNTTALGKDIRNLKQSIYSGDLRKLSYENDTSMIVNCLQSMLNEMNTSLLCEVYQLIL